MTTEVITALIGLFCTIVGSTVTFFLTRKKYLTEVDSQQIENMSKSFDTYKKMMEETLEAQKRINEATIKGLTEKVANLESENSFLKRQIEDLRSQMIEFLGNKFKAENK